MKNRPVVAKYLSSSCVHRVTTHMHIYTYTCRQLASVFVSAACFAWTTIRASQLLQRLPGCYHQPSCPRAALLLTMVTFTGRLDYVNYYAQRELRELLRKRELLRSAWVQ